MNLEQLQELADSLVWEHPTDAKPIRQRDEDWNIGFAAGWNCAMRAVAEVVAPGSPVATKPYHQRIRLIERP